MNTQLKQFISDNQLSYAEFADSIGISENYVYQLVAGRKLTDTVIWRIAARYGWKAANELKRSRNGHDQPEGVR